MLNLPPLRLLPLQIDVRWRRPYQIPPHIIANVLRGAFNITFRRLVCPTEWMNTPCPPCPLYQQCPYGQVFEPTPPANADRLSKQADLPRPFVLHPPLVPSADPLRLTFGLVLFGRAIDSLPHFIVTLARLGEEGLGPARVPFQIVSLTAPHPRGPESLYDPATHRVTPPTCTLTEHDLARCPASGFDAGHLSADPAAPLPKPPATLTVHFQTPTLIKSGSGVDPSGRRIPALEVRDRPPFGVLIRRLRDRLAALQAFFGDAPWQTDFAALGQAADTVQLLDSQTTWLHRTRRSTRTGQSHELSGLLGQVTYTFPTPDLGTHLLPLLHFGEHLGVGKHAVWGNGWLRVEV